MTLGRDRNLQPVYAVASPGGSVRTTSSAKPLPVLYLGPEHTYLFSRYRLPPSAGEQGASASFPYLDAQGMESLGKGAFTFRAVTVLSGQGTWHRLPRPHDWHLGDCLEVQFR